MIGHFTDDDTEFLNSSIQMIFPGWHLWEPVAPIIFSEQKSLRLYWILPLDEDVNDIASVKEKLAPQFEAYRKMYADYYNSCKHPNSPAMRDANPVVLLYPGVGMFTFAKDKQTARVAAEFYINAINVMKGAEAISVNILRYQNRKHLILNIGCWKKQSFNECPSPKH